MQWRKDAGFGTWPSHTLTQTPWFHRTRRTRSSNSLRLRSLYSASSAGLLIFCFGALKSTSCSSLDSLNICSAVICRTQDGQLTMRSQGNTDDNVARLATVQAALIQNHCLHTCWSAGCLFLTLVARGNRTSVSRCVVPPMLAMVCSCRIQINRQQRLIYNPRR